MCEGRKELASLKVKLETKQKINTHEVRGPSELVLVGILLFTLVLDKQSHLC